MREHTPLPIGQQQARTRWGTHVTGKAFDRKKSTYLTEQAQEFIAQQAFCVIAGLDPQDELGGLLAMGSPGFVQTPDMHTCLLRLESDLATSRIFLRLRQSSRSKDLIDEPPPLFKRIFARLRRPLRDSQVTRLGLFFICHPTRERLCVQGTAELLPTTSIDTHYPPPSPASIWLFLNVAQSFFHCPKYIRTHIPGLTQPPQRKKNVEHLHGHNQSNLSKAACAFIAEQRLCFLCTVDQDGQCAVNHRNGHPGFLVTLPPDKTFPGGILLLPDYKGNGAFEAIGNILETGQAALVIPDYAAQLALCISGTACILELQDLPAELAKSCVGAERVIALSVQCVETQYGDWSTTLAYERTRAQSIQAHGALCRI